MTISAVTWCIELRRHWIKVILIVCTCALLAPVFYMSPRDYSFSAYRKTGNSVAVTSVYRTNVSLVLNNRTYYSTTNGVPRKVDFLQFHSYDHDTLPQSRIHDINVTLNVSNNQNQNRSVITINQLNFSHSHIINQGESNAEQDPFPGSSHSSIFKPNVTNKQTICCDSNTILTLFTTFKDSPDRLYPQSQIVRNWAQYRPWIQPVLYSPDSNGTLIDLARKNGWYIYEEQGSNKHGTPLLKPMFAHAMENFNTTLYGFANGDILFNAGLIDTIKYLNENKNRINTTFVTGRRWNFAYYKYDQTTLGDIWSSQRVNEIRKKSSLFSRDAEDYFLVSRDYPFHELKDVVIGRPGYDNYLVAMSIRLNVSTVDATESIAAVHITLNGSIFAGARNKDSRYNKNLIGRFNYNQGLTTSTRFATYYDKKSKVISMRQRWDPIEKAKKDKAKKEKKQAKKKKVPTATLR